MDQTVQKKWYLRWYMWIVYVFLVIIVMSTNSAAKKKAAQQNTDTPVVATESSTESPVEDKSKADAQKEFDELMALSKKAGLVDSYKFVLDSDLTIYVGSVWYTQKAEFKKDFLAKVSVLKKAITGYHRLEVRDAYSNEKVAEVTALTGSLEVYK